MKKLILVLGLILVSEVSHALPIITVYETRGGVRYKVTYVGDVEVRRVPVNY